MEGLEATLRGLSLARRSRPEEPTYLLDAALHPTGPLAVSCSDLSIRLHDRDTLTPLGAYRGHGGPVSGVVFPCGSSDLLYSGSADGTIRAWDTRRPGSDAAQTFRSDPTYSLCSFDLSGGDTLLCAGTEQVNEEDSFLLFWDARKPGSGLLGAYSESHSDDITQVRFHPDDKDRLATGSTDGLVNVFDLSRGGEEEALLATCNSESSAGALCWCGGTYTRLLCLSHDQGLHLWDLCHLDTDDPLLVFSAPDARALAPAPLDYLVGGRWLEHAQKLLVVGGRNDGELHLMECDEGGLGLLGTLRGGHTSTVRCFLWDAAGQTLITGGEDSQLLLWKPGGEELMGGKKESRKSQSALRLKTRPRKKHGCRREKEAAQTPDGNRGSVGN
ncbi:WD repeat-containing protein 89 [Antennarius striatus]|uniref:WD repeat-containing protein 89 n=1 Tax=Antennarius striatus TaxID=241820 RepID=UPI0035B0C0E0